LRLIAVSLAGKKKAFQTQGPKGIETPPCCPFVGSRRAVTANRKTVAKPAFRLSPGSGSKRRGAGCSPSPLLAMLAKKATAAGEYRQPI
jgi:hypothetical protein